jgi:glutamine synthetase
MDKQFEFVRLTWIDYAGVRRCRVVPRSRLESIKETGVGYAYACLFVPAHADAPPTSDPAGQATGESRLIPDMATLQPLPWSPGESMVLVNMHREADTPGMPTAGPWDCCPRTVLAHALQQLEEEAGVSLMAGFECEFTLFQAPAPGATSLPVPIDQTVYCETAAFDTASPVLQQICAALEEMGQSVEQVHAEAAPGQYEIATRYSPALDAADALVFRKEAICSVARRNGMAASFLPKIWVSVTADPAAQFLLL